MTEQLTTMRRELANRSSDGVEVPLCWSQRDGIDEVVVCVSDIRAGADCVIPAEPGCALDVFFHPFASSDISTPDDEDSRLPA